MFHFNQRPGTGRCGDAGLRPVDGDLDYSARRLLWEGLRGVRPFLRPQDLLSFRKPISVWNIGVRIDGAYINIGRVPIVVCVWLLVTYFDTIPS